MSRFVPPFFPAHVWHPPPFFLCDAPSYSFSSFLTVDVGHEYFSHLRSGARPIAFVSCLPARMASLSFFDHLRMACFNFSLPCPPIYEICPSPTVIVCTFPTLWPCCVLAIPPRASPQRGDWKCCRKTMSPKPCPWKMSLYSMCGLGLLLSPPFAHYSRSEAPARPRRCEDRLPVTQSPTLQNERVPVFFFTVVSPLSRRDTAQAVFCLRLPLLSSAPLDRGESGTIRNPYSRSSTLRLAVL